MPRKSKKLDSLKQTHGKVNTFEVTSLDQIWGGGDNSKFGTMDENVFQKMLTDFTRADLENYARKHGSVIVESSERIRAELMKVFRNYVSLLQKPTSKPQPRQVVSPEAQRVLNEGR